MASTAKQALKNLLRGGGLASIVSSRGQRSSGSTTAGGGATRAMAPPQEGGRPMPGQHMPGMNGLGEYAIGHEYGPYGALFPQSPVTKVTAAPRQQLEPTLSPRLAPNFSLVSPSLDGLGAAPYGGGSESGPLFPVPSVTRVVPTPERPARRPVPPAVVPYARTRLGVSKTALAPVPPTLYAPNAFPETSPPLDGCGCGGFGAFVAEPGQAASMDRNALHGLGEDSGGGGAGKMIVGLAVLGGVLYFAAGGLGHKGGARAR